jgi:hemerythrin
MITWNSHLETGNAVVDNDHKALINQINALDAALKAGTAKEELGPMIGFLDKYVRAHFAREEGIMRTVKCPASGQNCVAHLALVRKLDGWVIRLKTGGATTSLVLEIYREASAWLQQHIVKVDCQLRTN